MQIDEVRVEDADGVRTITLHRPQKRNALTLAMYEAITDALGSAEAAKVGAILLTATGPNFTAGNDLADFVAQPPEGEDAPVFRFLHALLECPLPLVAAVEGRAVGIGTTLLLHCDLVYAAPTALFSVPFVDLGLVPEAASSVLLPRILGHAQAGRMILLGEPLDAASAAAGGLITAVVPADELQATARAKAQALAKKPRAAMRATKALLRPERQELRAVMAREGKTFGELLRSPETVAILQAFLTKGR